MRALIFLSLILVLSSGFPTPANLKDFVIGNLVSLQVVQSVPDGFACAQNLATLQNNTKEALDLFLGGHFVDALHLIEQTINGTISTCEAANREGVLLFENFLNIVSDPNFVSTALGRIRDNQLTLLDDLALGVEYLNNQSFFMAGVTLGKIPHLILSGPSTYSSDLNLLQLGNISSPLMDFLRGYLEAVKVWANVPDGLQCIDDIAGIKDSLSQVLALLKQFRILEAIQLLENGVAEDFTRCTSAITETVQLFDAFKQNIGQAGFFDLAKGRIFDNALTLLQDFQSGVAAIINKDYYGAGRALGDVPHIVLSGPDP
jgi:uncharacterized protein YejL (UPF0352 family)